MYTDRRDGGEQLKDAVLQAVSVPENASIQVYGIPRGGVVTAKALADHWGVRVRPWVSVKLRAPRNPELAVGALSIGIDPVFLPGESLWDQLNDEARERILCHGQQEIADRMDRYGVEEQSARGSFVVLIDDGTATGLTILAAAQSIRSQNPRHLVIAVPVASQEAATLLRPLCDQLVIPWIPRIFFAVGEFYREFAATTDAEVRSIIGSASSEKA